MFVLVSVASWRIVTIVHVSVSHLPTSSVLTESTGEKWGGYVCFWKNILWHYTLWHLYRIYIFLRILHAFMFVCVCVHVHMTSWSLRSSKFWVMQGTQFIQKCRETYYYRKLLYVLIYFVIPFPSASTVLLSSPFQ